MNTLKPQEPFFFLLIGQEAMIFPQNPVAIHSDYPVTEIPEDARDPKAYSGSYSISTQPSCDAKSSRAALINLSSFEKINRVQPRRMNTMLGQ